MKRTSNNETGSTFLQYAKTNWRLLGINALICRILGPFFILLRFAFNYFFCIWEQTIRYLWKFFPNDSWTEWIKCDVFQIIYWSHAKTDKFDRSEKKAKIFGIRHLLIEGVPPLDLLIIPWSFDHARLHSHDPHLHASLPHPLAYFQKGTAREFRTKRVNRRPIQSRFGLDPFWNHLHVNILPKLVMPQNVLSGWHGVLHWSLQTIIIIIFYQCLASNCPENKIDQDLSFVPHCILGVNTTDFKYHKLFILMFLCRDSRGYPWNRE